MSLEYRAMWSKVEDDELVRQLHNEWERWVPSRDKDYWPRQVEYMRYTWLLSRSREISARLKVELRLVWRYLMSVFNMYVRQNKDEILRKIRKAFDENNDTEDHYWHSELARLEGKLVIYNEILKDARPFVQEIHDHEATAEGMRILYQELCERQAVVMPMGTIHASMSPIETQGPKSDDEYNE